MAEHKGVGFGKLAAEKLTAGAVELVAAVSAVGYVGLAEHSSSGKVEAEAGFVRVVMRMPRHH